MIHLVEYSQNYLPVYVDLVKSLAAKRIARQPYLLTLAAEVLRHTILNKPVVHLEYDIGRTIGYDFVVETTNADAIFYAQLVRDNVYTRFTRNGKPVPTRYVSLVLQRTPDDTYIALDLRVGHFSPPRPGSVDETARSKTYWENHALVFDKQAIQSSTLTKMCPY